MENLLALLSFTILAVAIVACFRITLRHTAEMVKESERYLSLQIVDLRQEIAAMQGRGGRWCEVEPPVPTQPVPLTLEQLRDELSPPDNRVRFNQEGGFEAT